VRMALFVQPINEIIVPYIEKIDAFTFTGGESRTLALQLLQSYNKKHFFTPAGWGAMITLPTADSYTFLNYEGQVNAIDSSIYTINMSISDTLDAISGRIKISLINIADPNAIEISSPFVPTSYSTSTGNISIPDTLVAAFFDGMVAGMTTNIVLTAVTAGPLGNNIILNFNGTTSISTAITAWNTTNPTNTVVLTSGDGTQIPNDCTKIQLAGGADQPDLSSVKPGDIYLDGAGNRFIILQVNNTEGYKEITIGLNKTVNLTSGQALSVTGTLIAIRDSVFVKTRL